MSDYTESPEGKFAMEKADFEDRQAPAPSPTTGLDLDLDAIKARLAAYYADNIEATIWRDMRALLAEVALLEKREQVAMESLGEWIHRAEKAEADLAALRAGQRELVAKWRQQADESGFEATRIYNTVKVHTDAQERCYARQQVWNGCADALAALAPRGETPQRVPKDCEHIADVVYRRDAKGDIQVSVEAPLGDPSPAPPRLVALARAEADRRHMEAFEHGNSEGHNPHYAYCPHPDCALVRDAHESK